MFTPPLACIATTGGLTEEPVGTRAAALRPAARRRSLPPVDRPRQAGRGPPHSDQGALPHRPERRRGQGHEQPACRGVVHVGGRQAGPPPVLRRSPAVASYMHAGVRSKAAGQRARRRRKWALSRGPVSARPNCARAPGAAL